MFTDMYLQMQQNSRQFLCVRSKSNDVEVDFVGLLLILTVSSSTGDVLDQQYQMVHILSIRDNNVVRSFILGSPSGATKVGLTFPKTKKKPKGI